MQINGKKVPTSVEKGPKAGFHIIGAAIRTRQESLCLLYTQFVVVVVMFVCNSFNILPLSLAPCWALHFISVCTDSALWAGSVLQSTCQCVVWKCMFQVVPSPCNLFPPTTIYFRFFIVFDINSCRQGLLQIPFFFFKLIYSILYKYSASFMKERQVQEKTPEGSLGGCQVLNLALPCLSLKFS